MLKWWKTKFLLREQRFVITLSWVLAVIKLAEAYQPIADDTSIHQYYRALCCANNWVSSISNFGNLFSRNSILVRQIYFGQDHGEKELVFPGFQLAEQSQLYTAGFSSVAEPNDQLQQRRGCLKHAAQETPAFLGLRLGKFRSRWRTVPLFNSTAFSWQSHMYALVPNIENSFLFLFT